MGINVQASERRTIEATPVRGIVRDGCPGNGDKIALPEAGAIPGSGTDENDWFYNVAITVFGRKETGYHLHLATGWPRTSCYAFVARDPDQRRKVNTEFLRVLFRSDHGRPFFNAFMHGSDAQWCRDLERAERIAAAIDAIK